MVFDFAAYLELVSLSLRGPCCYRTSPRTVPQYSKSVQNSAQIRRVSTEETALIRYVSTGHHPAQRINTLCKYRTSPRTALVPQRVLPCTLPALPPSLYAPDSSIPDLSPGTSM
eukprot:24784-Rhodomonas_salina.1